MAALPLGAVHLNPGDCDQGFGFLGPALLRARRANNALNWIGVRANMGVASGRVAFSMLNETGGNIRLGYSTQNSGRDLGMRETSFGFGGTGTKSHAGRSPRSSTAPTACFELERERRAAWGVRGIF